MTIKRRVHYCKLAGHKVMQQWLPRQQDWICLHTGTKAQDLREVKKYEQRK